MQPAQQAADRGGDAGVAQVDRRAIDPPVEPQPAAAVIGGQPGDETPARAGHAGGQPDARRLHVRGHLRLAAGRFLAGFPEQLLDREAIRAQVKAPDPSHRTAGHRDDRSARYVRKPEDGADPADCRPASVDHTLSQPAHPRPPPEQIRVFGLGRASRLRDAAGWRVAAVPAAAGVSGLPAELVGGVERVVHLGAADLAEPGLAGQLAEF